jgi:hypothetical protein
MDYYQFKTSVRNDSRSGDLIANNSSDIIII